MCRDPEDVEGLDEESVEEWRNLRIYFIGRTRDPDWEAPEQSRLLDEHFDGLLGHGLLLLQPSPQPESTGSSRPDSEVGIAIYTFTDL